MQKDTCSKIARFSRTLNAFASTHEQGQKQQISYSEFQGFGAPEGMVGTIGDIYVDITHGNCALYAKVDDDGWKKWPGPGQRTDCLKHPRYPSHILWCKVERNTLGWIGMGHVTRILSELAALWIVKREAIGQGKEHTTSSRNFRGRLSSSSQVISAILSGRRTALQRSNKKRILKGEANGSVDPARNKIRLSNPLGSTTQDFSQAGTSTDPGVGEISSVAGASMNTAPDYLFSIPPMVNATVTFIDKCDLGNGNDSPVDPGISQLSTRDVGAEDPQQANPNQSIPGSSSHPGKMFTSTRITSTTCGLAKATTQPRNTICHGEHSDGHSSATDIDLATLANFKAFGESIKAALSSKKDATRAAELENPASSMTIHQAREPQAFSLPKSTLSEDALALTSYSSNVVSVHTLMSESSEDESLQKQTQENGQEPILRSALSSGSSRISSATLVGDSEVTNNTGTSTPNKSKTPKALMHSLPGSATQNGMKTMRNHVKELNMQEEDLFMHSPFVCSSPKFAHDLIADEGTETKRAGSNSVSGLGSVVGSVGIKEPSPMKATARKKSLPASDGAASDWKQQRKPTVASRTQSQNASSSSPRKVRKQSLSTEVLDLTLDSDTSGDIEVSPVTKIKARRRQSSSRTHKMRKLEIKASPPPSPTKGKLKIMPHPIFRRRPEAGSESPSKSQADDKGEGSSKQAIFGRPTEVRLLRKKEDRPLRVKPKSRSTSGNQQSNASMTDVIDLTLDDESDEASTLYPLLFVSARQQSAGSPERQRENASNGARDEDYPMDASIDDKPTLDSPIGVDAVPDDDPVVTASCERDVGGIGEEMKSEAGVGDLELRSLFSEAGSDQEMADRDAENNDEGLNGRQSEMGDPPDEKREAEYGGGDMEDVVEGNGGEDEDVSMPQQVEDCDDRNSLSEWEVMNPLPAQTSLNDGDSGEEGEEPEVEEEEEEIDELESDECGTDVVLTENHIQLMVGRETRGEQYLCRFCLAQRPPVVFHVKPGPSMSKALINHYTSTHAKMFEDMMKMSVEQLENIYQAVKERWSHTVQSSSSASSST
ncbi:hypothetical protein AX17_003640 [Amanita inopinata Kibby_2008]|nr:hypothetical protein AX17_003934 [Amanita inopinata Kibby_2008]KAF8636309.1 hypothetical protein AX17_003640 [Amanita inopinata Kibby_2008]